MMSMTCRSCGSDVSEAAAGFCSSCDEGIPTEAGDAAPVEAGVDPVDTGRNGWTAEDRWQAVTWGAMALGAVALVALVAVVFGLLNEADRDATARRGQTTTTVTTAAPDGDEPVQALEIINPALTGAVTVEAPRVGATARYHRNGEVVVFRLVGRACGGADGVIGASGSIRNESPVGQTLSYVIGVDLVRAWTGSRLARLEANVDDLPPGVAADWSVEMISSQVTTLRCRVADIAVTPPQDR